MSSDFYTASSVPFAPIIINTFIALAIGMGESAPGQQLLRYIVETIPAFVSAMASR